MPSKAAEYHNAIQATLRELGITFTIERTRHAHFKYRWHQNGRTVMYAASGSPSKTHAGNEAAREIRRIVARVNRGE